MADFVVCESDPLTDIGVLGDPTNAVLVIQNGAVRKDSMPEDAYVARGHDGGLPGPSARGRGPRLPGLSG